MRAVERRHLSAIPISAIGQTNPYMPRAPAFPVLRAGLRSSSSNGYVSFVPQIRKLVFEFCERWPTSEPLRNVLKEGAETVARENPHVEVVIRKRMFKEPLIRGFYCKLLRLRTND